MKRAGGITKLTSWEKRRGECSVVYGAATSPAIELRESGIDIPKDWVVLSNSDLSPRLCASIVTQSAWFFIDIHKWSRI
jgi:hypothetical protein